MTYGSLSIDVINTSGGQVIGASSAYPTMKNRIHNGTFMIDQRYNYAGQTMTSTGQYFADRWRTGSSGTWGSATFTSGNYTSGATIAPPPGYSSYMSITTGTADTLSTAGNAYVMTQWLEGGATQDFAWGTANAKTVTLSFWAYSSLTGNFPLSIQAALTTTRSYLTTYNIPVANTWTYCTVTIPGDTAGTTTNWSANTVNALTTMGLGLRFCLGAGASMQGAANTWSGNGYEAPTGSVNLCATSGAKLLITGVQLELGSFATTYDYRDYARELQLCQRYLFVVINANSVAGYYGGGGYIVTSVTSAALNLTVPFPVQMASAPSLLYSNASGTTLGGNWAGPGSGTFGTSSYSIYSTKNGATVVFSGANNTMTGSGGSVYGGAAVLYVFSQNSTSLIGFSCEF
jgi:hypothetical protein